ncbi:hypothetical protein C8J33_11611 [Rhizobium sp. PP-CC-3G-465]|nr:hypothetical protein C8J33_11611 [Rhizobium sp. PP-CC-3G-465]
MEDAVPTSLMWKAASKTGGWIASGMDILKAPSRVANGESRGRVLSGMVASTFVELQLQAKVVPHALNRFCKQPKGYVGGGICVAGVLGAVATTWKLGEMAKDNAENAASSIQDLAEHEGEPGLRMTELLTNQNGSLVQMPLSGDMCYRNEGSAVDVLKGLVGGSERANGACKVIDRQESADFVSITSECQGYLNSAPHVFKGTVEAKLTGEGGVTVVAIHEDFDGRMVQEYRRVYEACTYVEPDCSEEGQAAWVEAHAPDVINDECEASAAPAP